VLGERDSSGRGAATIPPELAGPYLPRPTSSLGTVEVEGWRFKLYRINAPGRPAPGVEWRPVMRELARQRLAEPGGHPERYGVGFAIVHHGREANFVLLDWWVGENMLENHVYVSPLDDPEALEYATPTGLSACVWELRVMAFEREAWISTVLDNPGGRPDLDAYLEHRLEGSF
jgi:hypothetical protein